MKRPEPWAVKGRCGLYETAQIAELWRLYREAVHENAALARENDTLRWKLSQARHDEDFTWMTD